MNDTLPIHETLVFERFCPASIEAVFEAFADPVRRAGWAAPSDTAAFIYDETDFREGGQDIFRCGDKQNPQFLGVTRYYEIVPMQLVVTSETIETEGRKLLISMTTTQLARAGAGTTITVTTQLTSLAGTQMIEGARTGNNAALDNLVEALR